MSQNSEYLFDKDYFEEGKGLINKRIYNWQTTALYFKVIADSIHNGIKSRIALDIGCAKGYLVYLLQESGIDAYGVDISSYAISCAPDKIRNKLQVLDIEKDDLPFPNNYFDLVIILEVLEHLSFFEHLIGEIKRILKNEGYILVTIPTPMGRHAKADKTHINVQSRKTWIDLFNKYNLALDRNHIWYKFKSIF